MPGLQRRRRRMVGGLHFGRAGWVADRWHPAADGSSAPHTAALTPAATPGTASDLLEWLDRAGIARTSPWISPLAEQITTLNGRVARAIVLNMIPAEPESNLPYALAHLAMPEMLAGLQLLRRCIPSQSTLVAAEKQDGQSLKRWRVSVRKKNIQLIALLNTYPQADPVVLLRTLFGLALPAGRSPASVGVVLVDPVCCWAMGRYAHAGATMEHRPVQLFSCDAPPRLALAQIGSSIERLLQAHGLPTRDRQCILNGMMAGEEIDPAASCVQGSTESISLRPRPAAPTAHPCIRCGWCVDHCPTSLDPSRLHQLAAGGAAAAKEALGALDCVGCGLCSYVCPARLPLTQQIVSLRNTLRRHRD